MHDKDHKAWQDEAVPRTRRALHDVPMALLIGDVHYVDLLVADGKEPVRVRLIAWMDTSSIFIWVTPVFLSKGKGVRQEDVTENRTFESTVSVKRTDFADDRLGVFKPVFSEMGNLARQHQEELVFWLLASGFTANGFDGQSFFDTDHPVRLTDNSVVTVANRHPGGNDPAWFLLDTSRGIRPIIWQEREKYEFQAMRDSNDPHVFMHDEYLFGVRARVNAGFGLWQLAFGSKMQLDADSYADARAAMMGFRADGGRILGVQPSVLVVPPSLEQAALRILNAESQEMGQSNIWRNTAQLIVTPWLAG